MTWFSLAVALLAALAILWIGFRYLISPRTMAPSFGLPLPEDGANTTWWLRLKGVRDIASGVLVLAMMAWDRHRTLGLVLLVEALIPVGDMSTVLAARGRKATAFCVHGVTAALMIAAGLPLILGVA